MDPAVTPVNLVIVLFIRVYFRDGSQEKIRAVVEQVQNYFALLNVKRTRINVLLSRVADAALGSNSTPFNTLSQALAKSLRPSMKWAIVCAALSASGQQSQMPSDAIARYNVVACDAVAAAAVARLKLAYEGRDVTQPSTLLCLRRCSGGAQSEHASPRIFKCRSPNERDIASMGKIFRSLIIAMRSVGKSTRPPAARMRCHSRDAL